MDNLQQLRDWTGRISGIANGYKLSQVLFTALNGGVFELLQSPATADEVANALQWSKRGTAMLLDGLVAVDLVDKQDKRYCNNEVAAACLVEGGAAYQGHILRHSNASWDAWKTLPERVRTGTCGDASEDWSGEALRNFILGMRDIAQISAREVLEMVDLAGYTNMLDLAGGPATYAITFLLAHPQLRATLFDMPDVIDIAREEVAAAGVQDRFNYIAGDCMRDSLDDGYDMVFMSNIIHSFSLEENAALVKRVYEALAPGGTIIIKDFILENDRTGPAFALIFALHMLVHTPAGNTYTFDEIKDWTDNAGFVNGRAASLTPQTRLWVAEKPA